MDVYLANTVNRNNPRDDLDYYPTPTEAVRQALKHVLPIREGMIVWEPCVGTGTLADAVEN